jgi:hypothetical protein
VVAHTRIKLHSTYSFQVSEATDAHRATRTKRKRKRLVGDQTSTCLELFAEAARAFRVSFLLLASASLPSIARVLLRSCSTAFSCCASCPCHVFSCSSKPFLFLRASRARSSSPAFTASSARDVQESYTPLSTCWSSFHYRQLNRYTHARVDK